MIRRDGPGGQPRLDFEQLAQRIHPAASRVALLAETTSGRILAALDVTDPEPLPADHPLWRSPGVLITPHVGGDSTAFVPRGRRLVEQQLERWATGLPLLNVIPLD